MCKDQSAIDGTPILRLARELGRVYDEVMVYDEYAVDRRLSAKFKARCDRERDIRNWLVQDLDTAIMLSRAECLDDVVCQSMVAFGIADILQDYVDPEGKQYAVQMKNAITSMAAVLLRDHGEAYRERVGNEYCPRKLLVGDRPVKGDLRTLMEDTIAVSDAAMADRAAKT
jgi:hypothetical protein